MDESGIAATNDDNSKNRSKVKVPFTPIRQLSETFSADSPTLEQHRKKFRHPSKVNLLELASASLAAAIAASKPIQKLSGWSKNDSCLKNPRLKLDGTVVTDADGAAQHIIVQAIRNVSKQVRIVGEESRSEMEITKYVDYRPENLDSNPERQPTQRELYLSEEEFNYTQIHDAADEEIRRRYAKRRSSENKMAYQDLQLGQTFALEVLSTRVSVFVDPLDGTKSYAGGDYDSVTTLVCIILDNIPIFGVISKPFGLKDEPTVLDTSCSAVYGGMLLNGAYVAGGKECKRSILFKQITYEKEGDIVRDENEAERSSRRAVISKSRSGGVVGRCIDSLSSKGLLNQSPAFIAGAGVKSLSLISGNENESLWFFPREGTSLWDIAACDALLRCIGGRLSDKNGYEIDYSKSRSNADNLDGIVAANDTLLHEECIRLYKEEQWDNDNL